MSYQKCDRCGWSTYYHKAFVAHMAAHGIDASGSGWHESQRPTATGELKSLEHQITQLKNQFAQQNVMNVPLPPPRNIREEIKVVYPWIRSHDDRNTFEVEVNLGNAIEETFKRTTKGSPQNKL